MRIAKLLISDNEAGDYMGARCALVLRGVPDCVSMQAPAGSMSVFVYMPQ
jgi:hypothetical protein